MCGSAKPTRLKVLAGPEIRHLPWTGPGDLRYALDWIRSVAKPPVIVTDPPADILLESDVNVPTRDGTVLRINVFRKADDGSAMREITLLRLRALLVRARGDDDAYRDLVRRYRAMAESLGFEGHIAWAGSMIAGRE